MSEQFEAALAEAKELASILTACADDGSADATVVMACCILIHRLDPSGKNLAPFARKLLQGRAWIDEAMETT